MSEIFLVICFWLYLIFRRRYYRFKIGVYEDFIRSKRMVFDSDEYHIIKGYFECKNTMELEMYNKQILSNKK